MGWFLYTVTISWDWHGQILVNVNVSFPVNFSEGMVGSPPDNYIIRS